MSAPVFMRRHMGALRPVDAASETALASVLHNEIVEVQIKRRRNLAHHRKWWKLVQVVFPHQSTYSTIETFHAALKCALGHADAVTLPDGRVMLVPRSIAFAKMDQAAFEQFYERAVDLICSRILPRLNREDLMEEVGEILEGSGRRAHATAAA